MRRQRLWLAALMTVLLAAAMPSLAHHGWNWAEADTIELSGTITAVRLGNPHGELTLDVDGTAWTVEVGQPWRNRRAGLKDGDLTEGTAIRVRGAPSRNPDEKRLKVVRLWIGESEYTLYPDRV